MKKTEFSRQYLESISTADLISLADDYGIDIPSNLTRRFIIGELLELAEEMESSKKDAVQIIDDPVEMPDSLPASYNETQIYAVQRTPAWIYAFWDLNETQPLNNGDGLNYDGLFLHVAFFDTATSDTPSDSFDVNVGRDDRQQYVFVPAGKKYVIINLKCEVPGEEPRVLAYTKRLEIPQENPQVASLSPGQKLDVNPLVSLSGMDKTIRSHYRNHRQSFS